MISTKNYFELAQLAEASYAKFDLFAADKTKDALIAEGFSDKQADLFFDTWQLVSGGHQPNTASGFSSTLFKSLDTGGGYVLAIRGTELTTQLFKDLVEDDIGTDIDLAVGLPMELNLQYIALKDQVQTWLGNGTLAPGFTVSGHSLGGYLAAAVKQTYPQVTDAYLFNAPGVGGVLGNLSDALTSALGLSGAPTGNIWNVRGSEGFPLISGLSYQRGVAFSIQGGRTNAGLEWRLAT